LSSRRTPDLERSSVEAYRGSSLDSEPTQESARRLGECGRNGHCVMSLAAKMDRYADEANAEWEHGALAFLIRADCAAAAAPENEG